jgi:hypothetical protein
MPILCEEKQRERKTKQKTKRKQVLMSVKQTKDDIIQLKRLVQTAQPVKENSRHSVLKVRPDSIKVIIQMISNWLVIQIMSNKAA